MTTMFEIVSAQKITGLVKVYDQSRFILKRDGSYCVVEMANGQSYHVGRRYDSDLGMQIFYVQDNQWVGDESTDFADIIKFLERL